MVNRIVAHYSDGRLLKGATANFFPGRPAIHLSERSTGAYRTVNVRDLKALFFVKSYDGNPFYRDRQDVERVGLGKRIKVTFNDGEVMVGYTQGYAPTRASFIVFPADPDSNNEKVLVVSSGARDVAFL